MEICYHRGGILTRFFGLGILYHSFRKFAASRPKAMKKPLSPVIASAAKQSPGRYGDCFAACGDSRGRVEEFKFPEGKIHYLLNERYSTGGQPLYRRPAVGLAGPGRAW
jgi:hypothetical protein